MGFTLVYLGFIGVYQVLRVFFIEFFVVLSNFTEFVSGQI